MILRKFDYSEYKDEANEWLLDGLILEKINLLVGKNATGKTNSIARINLLSNILNGILPQLLKSGNYNVEFIDNEDIYRYELNLSSQRVAHEKLSINNEEKFIRESNGISQISTTQPQEKDTLQLPLNQLVVHPERDARQYPFLVQLIKWAKSIRLYQFSSPMGKDHLSKNDLSNVYVNPHDMNSVVTLYLHGDKIFPKDFRKKIVDFMKEIGYELNNIEVDSNPDSFHLDPDFRGVNGLMLYVEEKNIKTKIFQPQISQGMFRALSIIIHITYNIMMKEPTTILIDDIGEGLDFERSTKLIKLLIELAENNDNIQLTMSTNDRFVMNNVPFKYWQLIDRQGGKCTIYNYQNSKEIFDEFKYTGLNNFDFLTTDFIHAERIKN